MDKVFFHKNGRTAILDSRGQRIPFEMLGDARNVIATEDDKLIADLRLYITRKLGGVSEIDEATYEDLKKNLPHRPELSFARRSQQHRLLETENMVPKSRSPEQASVQPAAAPASAGRAVASAPVRTAVAPAKPGEPKSGGRPVRTNAKSPAARATAPVTAPEISDVPPPPVEASAPATPEQPAGDALNPMAATTEQ